MMICTRSSFFLLGIDSLTIFSLSAYVIRSSSLSTVCSSIVVLFKAISLYTSRIQIHEICYDGGFENEYIYIYSGTKDSSDSASDTEILDVTTFSQLIIQVAFEVYDHERKKTLDRNYLISKATIVEYRRV